MRNLPLLLLAFALPGAALGQSAAPEPFDAAAFERSLHFQTGRVLLPGADASVTTGAALRFLGPDDARRVIVDAWGNPPEQAEDVLGMIFPADLGPTHPKSWGVVLTHTRDGHVKDDEAARTDFNKVLRDMQASVRDGNDARREAGYDTIDLVGWAQAPHYDPATHKMFWAKEIAFGGDTDHTLNYAVRVLGRDSVLELNAVAPMTELAAVDRGMRGVLTNVAFDPGHRYEDFRPGQDRLAEYGIVALVAGGVAAKAGLFAKIGLLLLGLKKFWVLGLAAIAGLVSRFRRA